VTRARRTDYQDDDKGVAAGAAAGGVCPPNVTTPARPGQARRSLVVVPRARQLHIRPWMPRQPGQEKQVAQGAKSLLARKPYA
jgi:hypothetical protein